VRADVPSTDTETDGHDTGHATRDWRSVAAPAVLVVLCVGLFAAFTWNFLRELDTLGTAGPPGLVFLLGLTLSAGIGAWAYRIHTDDLAPPDRWAVTLWSVGGVVALSVVVGFTLWIRIAEGRTVEEPQLPFLVAVASGGHLGAIAGYYYAEARSRAAETNRAREALSFLNRTIRHEVLNGMTVIQGNATRVRNDPDDADPLTAIEAESQDISERMRNVHGVVSVLAGDVDLDGVDLSATAESRVTFTRTAHPDARIETDIDPGVVVQGADPLEHAIDNLLGNAIEHGAGPRDPTGERQAEADVVVRVREDGDDGVLTVTDDGPGISEEQLAQLFEPDEDGTHGFGLYLVRTLVEQCGGHITARNEPDRGATFEIRLPLVDDAGA